MRPPIGFQGGSPIFGHRYGGSVTIRRYDATGVGFMTAVCKSYSVFGEVAHASRCSIVEHGGERLGVGPPPFTSTASRWTKKLC